HLASNPPSNAQNTNISPIHLPIPPQSVHKIAHVPNTQTIAPQVALGPSGTSIQLQGPPITPYNAISSPIAANSSTNQASLDAKHNIQLHSAQQQPGMNIMN